MHFFGRSFKVKGQCTCDAREARVGPAGGRRVWTASGKRVMHVCDARGNIAINSMRSENFTSFCILRCSTFDGFCFRLYDVVCLSL